MSIEVFNESGQGVNEESLIDVAVMRWAAWTCIRQLS